MLSVRFDGELAFGEIDIMEFFLFADLNKDGSITLEEYYKASTTLSSEDLEDGYMEEEDDDGDDNQEIYDYLNNGDL